MPQFHSRCGWCDTQNMPEGANAQKQACLGLQGVREKVGQLVKPSEAAHVELFFVGEKGCYSAQEELQVIEEAGHGDERLSSKPTSLLCVRYRSKLRSRRKYQPSA